LEAVRAHLRGRGRHGLFGGRSHGSFPFGPFAPFDARQFWGPGRRVARGDVRAAVLRLLAEAPRNGYQIIQELTERSGGFWRPSPGSIYPTLQQLEDEGLVRAEEKDGKRVFHLTDAGWEAAEKAGADAAPWEVAGAAAREAAIEVPLLISQVADAFIQVAMAGNTAQLDKAKVVMVNTRRALYRILAEDEPDDVTDL
jgi:DNA-binding PadR family transcriptional regulator